MRYLTAADTGGTFTDLAVYDTDTGKTTFGKTLTDYGDLIAGVIRGLGDTNSDIGNTALLKHGTTHVINALLERRGARTALVTTQGFRDALEIARGNRSVPFDLRFRRAEPLIPRSLRFEVEERIDGEGRVPVASRQDARVGGSSDTPGTLLEPTPCAEPPQFIWPARWPSATPT